MKILQTTISALFLSTLFASAGATISPSNDPIQICDSTPYLELNAVGDPTNHLYTWTVNDDIHAYGSVFYYVPAEEGDSNNIVRLYEGILGNGTVDKDPATLLDEVTVNVNDCNV